MESSHRTRQQGPCCFEVQVFTQRAGCIDLAKQRDEGLAERVVPALGEAILGGDPEIAEQHVAFWVVVGRGAVDEEKQREAIEWIGGPLDRLGAGRHVVDNGFGGIVDGSAKQDALCGEPRERGAQWNAGVAGDILDGDVGVGGTAKEFLRRAGELARDLVIAGGPGGLGCLCPAVERGHADPEFGGHLPG